MKQIEIRKHPKFFDLYISGPSEKLKLYSKNLIPRNSVYGEKLINYKETEYREWDPYRSKLAALFLENPITNMLKKDLNILYLGASSGTTVSHLSDMITEGIIYAVEFSERSIRQLIQNVKNRDNIISILGDARYPESYLHSIFTEIDLIYQDVAQPNQADIAILNSKYYLKENGLILLTIKSQSIDSISKSDKVYSNEKLKLEDAGYKIMETVNIHKYAAHHIFFIIRKRTKQNNL